MPSINHNNRVLLIGSGGREHAIAWKLSQSLLVERIYLLPGSDAIAHIPKCVRIVLEGGLQKQNHTKIVEWCTSNRIALVVVGPEHPLADGLEDVLYAAKIPCFGPSEQGAQIECDKSWSKNFMRDWMIPTARFETFKDVNAAKKFIMTVTYPALVVKACGLAAGKGVIVANTREEACHAVDLIMRDRRFGVAGETIVVEEKLEGPEISLLAFLDGNTVRVMLPAQDHKRLCNGDTGPNTGGMGAYCPCPLISEFDLKFAVESFLQRVSNAFFAQGIRYRGVLYAGLMLTRSGPKALEFNCRFGDPEAQVLLPLLENDLFDVMLACTNRTLKNVQLHWRHGVKAVGVVMASAGYPEWSSDPQEIVGLRPNTFTDMTFHSGTVSGGTVGLYRTNGGRVLINVALADTVHEAAVRATAACERIRFNGAQYRTDIANAAIE